MPFPPPGNLPDLGIEPASPVSPELQADSLATQSSGKLKIEQVIIFISNSSIIPYHIQVSQHPGLGPGLVSSEECKPGSSSVLILFARTSPSYILLPVIDSALEEGKKSFVFFFF